MEEALFAHANNAATKWNVAVGEEENELNEYMAYLEGSGGDSDTPTTLLLLTADGTKPYLPNENFSQVEGTNLSNGLVITDHETDGVSDGNEYVWIEVPNAKLGGNPTFGPDYSLVIEESDEYYTQIENALRTYIAQDDFITIGTDSDNEKTTTKGFVDEWYAWNVTENKAMI